MYKLSKALFALFMINYIWFSRTFSIPSWTNYILIVGFTVTGVLSSGDFFNQKKVFLKLNKYFMYWSVFVIYVLVSGIFVAKNYSIVLNHVSLLLEVLLVLLYVGFIAETEGTLRFFYQVFMVIAAIYTLSLLRNGVMNSRSGRLYLSETSNPNSDGIVLAFGVYSTLKLIDLKKPANLVPLLALSVVEFYGIFLTGSRKALILAAVFFVFSLLRTWNRRKELSDSTKIFLGLVFIVIIAFGVLWMLPAYMSSSAFSRMQDADVGINDRWNIALDALRVFSQHPFFGVGINNYKLYSSYGLYAHSTIPELLSGTGIIGTILFFIPYFSVFYSLLKKNMAGIDRVEIWGLLLCIMAISFVLIIPYGMPLSFFSILLFFQTDLAIKKAADENQSSGN